MSAEPATTSSALVPIEQFIWKAIEAPAKPDAAEIAAFIIMTVPANEAAPPRIIVLSDDGDEDEPPEPHDEWRRQLISALQDADRQTSPPVARSLLDSEVLPPLPYVEPRQRPTSGALNLGRPPRVYAPAPVERTPRHRVGLSLLGVSATAGFLSAVLPHATNMPDRAANAAGAISVVATRQDKAPADESDTFKPVMFSPVLVREGISPTAKASPPVLPAIEILRTVPVQIGRPLEVAPEPVPPAAQPDERPEPGAAPQPTPPAPSLDRERLALLAAVPPASAPMTPVPRAQEMAPISQAPAATSTPERRAAVERPAAAPSPRRTPQISTSYERAAPKAPKQARKRPSRSETKSASRAGQWETRRQGLRTAPPPAEEPSTMTKVLKSLWPFSSSESSSTGKSNLGAKSSDAPAPAKSKSSEAPTPSKSKDSFWWHERDARR